MSFMPGTTILFEQQGQPLPLLTRPLPFAGHS
jgi:hypothetical protein